MPSKTTMQKAKKDLARGKSASTAAGEFVHEEIDHVRRGKHGASSKKQAIAIGLSKARRAGVPLKPPKSGKRGGRVSAGTQRAAKRDYEVGQGKRKARPTSPARSRAAQTALGRQGRATTAKNTRSQRAKRAATRIRRRAHG
jgi:hypothetical protein